jgi:hypothetical protein
MDQLFHDRREEFLKVAASHRATGGHVYPANIEPLTVAGLGL